MKIRDLVEADYPDWLKLYEAYADHYEMALTPSGLETTWTWLMDDAHPVTGIVAETDAGLVGLAQFRAMPNPLRGHEIGFLDDLVVLPHRRGAGVADALLAALKKQGKQNGWRMIRWITRDNNYRARAVYDRSATKTDWNVYEMDCE